MATGKPALDRMRDSEGRLPACAWPGGYPILYITADGLTICPKCANDEQSNEGDPVEIGDVYWEGPDLSCEDCGGPIESAYGNPDEDKAKD